MSAELVQLPQLTLANLAAEGAASTSAYRNVVMSLVNEGCLRLSTFVDAPIFER